MIDNLNEILDNLEILIDCKNTKAEYCMTNNCKHYRHCKNCNNNNCLPIQLSYRYDKRNTSNIYLYSISIHSGKITIWDNINKKEFNVEEIRKLKNLKSL